MPGLLSQNGLAKRKTALAGFETGGSNGLLDRAGFKTSPELADAGIAKNLRQSAIEASQAPLASLASPSQAPALTAASARAAPGFGDGASQRGNATATLDAKGFSAQVGPPSEESKNIARAMSVVPGPIGLGMAITRGLQALGLTSVVEDRKSPLSLREAMAIADIRSRQVATKGGHVGGRGTGSTGSRGPDSGPGAGGGKHGSNVGGGFGEVGRGGRAEEGFGRGSVNDAGSGPGSGGGGPAGGPACCFTVGTSIRMADGTTRAIENVSIGDRVRGQSRINEVIGIDAPLLENRPLIAFNDSYPFTTWDHPFWDGAAWRCVKPESRVSTSGLHVEELNVGDRIVVETGAIEVTQIMSVAAEPKTQLYDLKLDGDHTYFANGYLVHNCLAGGLVTRKTQGPDVDGPGGDTGTIPIETGEFVIRKSAVKKYGLHVLRHINEGRVNRRGLLRALTRRP